MKAQFIIIGMTCGMCEAAVSKETKNSSGEKFCCELQNALAI
jgi:copper chaperone CopZ